MIVFGLFLIIVCLLIILELKKINIKKIERIILNILLPLIVIIYIIIVFIVKIEPFNFSITSVGDYFIYSAVIFIFSPFMWLVLYYYCNKLFKKMRVFKNAKIKSNKDYIYYRDDLNKVSPSIVMFTSLLDADLKKSLTATILKLKLTGHIKSVDNKLKCTDKSPDLLLEEEKMVLNAIKSNILDEKEYKKLILKETLDSKYIRKNKGGKFFKVFKIVLTLLVPIIAIIFSIKFDNYVFNNYQIYVMDNISYIKIKDEKVIEDLYYNEVKDMNDYYHSNIEIDGINNVAYSYNLIRADRYKYSIVRLRMLLNILVALSILLSISMVFVSLFMVIEQIIYFNKNYIRTIKGNELLNQAYALKNYLKDFSLIKDKKEEELVLWEYYLIYAVVLDVNVKIKDEIIEKYLKNLTLK